jgi:hypothetical protein
MASSSDEDMGRFCRWMRVLSFSGVEVPWRIIRRLIDIESQSISHMNKTKIDLAIAMQANTAYLDPREFADMCVNLLAVFVQKMDTAEEKVGSSDLASQ